VAASPASVDAVTTPPLTRAAWNPLRARAALGDAPMPNEPITGRAWARLSETPSRAAASKVRCTVHEHAQESEEGNACQ